MASRTTRENLIEVGLELVRSAGYSATGINQILEVAKIPKGSFYHHFSTKDEFVMEVIRRYATGELDRLERNLDDSTRSPMKKLRRYFKDLMATYGRRGGPIAGCLLGNLSLEIGGQNAEIRSLLSTIFDAWQNALAKTLRDAIAAGELPKTAKADDLAALLVNGWEGAQVRAKADQSDKPLELFFDNTFNVLLKG
ncbi:TetR/AcrR family transcriptional regulator [Terriglobus roseus]|uniref:Transcriptional regulator, TetR family n=1 Tax=Terriglobus roseus TaxID=392734 RepID=A0A1G7IN38_9BACT|nr:TetR/AcrR family transcriptional regulator [Terriglobus roseus]SDF14160.1 transcriptional regulator, TetR family [Terriglobus roseus]